ncbi:MAG TPA: ATP-binding protein [Gemmataceae bacterium]|jgi:two-component system sensor histidine kinase HydH|nr:ATP-binding protein [Gemmataceae bacterium]
MTGFRLRYLGPVVLIALCLLALCTVTAVSLFHQQAAVTGLLRENVESRRAASDLRGVLNTLIELETHHVEAVADLHARAGAHVAQIRELADQPAERDLAARLEAGFDEYLRHWDSLPPARDPAHEAAVVAATRVLEQRVLIPCREIEGYNDVRVADSTRHHEQVLRNLAWGLAVTGGLGAVAGVVLGYGVAQGLARSIRRLRVQIRDAAGKLGPDLPEIVLTEVGDFHGLHAEVDRLTERIEQVVRTLQRREREVLRAEQLAAVGQLAAGVAHEIRNPLTAIKMLVQAGMEDGGAVPAEDLGVIEAEVRRMERSLQTFLDFARPPKAERRPTDLATLLDGVVDLVRGRAEKQRVAVRTDLPAGGVTLTVDPEQLRQVFVNLALNALDAMPTGGTLTLTARPTPAGTQVEVADTGPGIAPAVLPRLFEPFASGKDTGLGLGLVISRRIVEDHGGTIAAANRAGGGASFLVTLNTAG